MTHRHTLTLPASIIAVLGMSHSAAFGQPSMQRQIADAATRAVAAIQRSQATWYDKQVCSSCHQQFQPAIAFAVARKHGIPIDEAIAVTNAARAFDFSDLDAAVQFANVVEPTLHEGYRMVAAHAAGVTPNLGTAIAARFLISRQRPGGDWSGLNQRPPSSSSDFTKTAFGLRAVQLFHHRADAQAAESAVARARTWLTSHRAPDTEGRTYQLLGLLWSEADRRLLESLSGELAATQRADGGWSSIDGRASEAYSTGEALVALHDAGVVKVSDPVWQRGLAFLLRTQAEDGTWHVPSRLHDPARLSPPYFESDYPYGHDQFISAAGAAWSVMALAQALPEVATPIRPTRAVVSRAESWLEATVFGTVAGLRDLLDRGLDPNTATAPGKTTLLMMAASDPEKLRLLVDRGADVNSRAASGFTALAVAAQYGDGTAAIDLLLARGAVGTPGAAQRAGNYALAFAAHAGNAAVLERLHRAGDPVNARFRLSSNGAPVTPMNKAIRNGDVNVVRALLDLGADVETAAGEPWSPLEGAVQNNSLDLARLFLERGADVNAVDKAGYTPLLLAASIDFGDTAMIELLLAAGADPAAKNPAGKTALDLAIEYEHHRFAPGLRRALADHRSAASRPGGHRSGTPAVGRAR
jgi:ankyrin repeat protein